MHGTISEPQNSQRGRHLSLTSLTPVAAQSDPKGSWSPSLFSETVCMGRRSPNSPSYPGNHCGLQFIPLET